MLDSLSGTWLHNQQVEAHTMKKQITTYRAAGLTGTQIDDGIVFWYYPDLQPAGITRDGKGYEVVEKRIANVEEAR